MLDKLFARFRDEPEPDDDADTLPRAVAALLIEAARADEEYTDEERLVIDKLLAACKKHNKIAGLFLFGTDGVEEHISPDFAMKASINALDEDDLAGFMDGDKPNLHMGGVKYADAVIKGSAELNAANTELLAKADKPVLDVQGEEAPAASVEFYHSLLEEQVAK